MTAQATQRLTSARAEKLAAKLRREGFDVHIKRDSYRCPIKVVGVKRLGRIYG